MTDKELRDAAIAKFGLELSHLKKTTRGLKAFTAPPSSEWGKALAERQAGLDLLAQIGGVVEPPVGALIFDGSPDFGVVPPWDFIQQKAANRFEAVGAENGVTPPSKMYRVVTQPGDTSSWTAGREITMAEKYLGVRVGSDICTGWSLYLPEDFTWFSGPPGSDNFGNNFIEWHGDRSGGMQQAPFHFRINGATNQWNIDLHNTAANWAPAFTRDIGPVVKNRWVNGVVRTKWSLGDGLIECWLDGNKVFSWQGRTWGTDNAIYPVAGTYRNPLPVATRFYIGHFKVGMTREIVDPGR